jgi:ABC-2 type transport system ATP-binding protein
VKKRSKGLSNKLTQGNTDSPYQTSMHVYEIINLTKFYPGQVSPANRDINLQIEAGEIFGLLGDNGAGKTTLVRQMVNLLTSTSGSIRLFDQPVSSDPLYAPRHVGYMPQDSLAGNNLTVGEWIYFTAHLRGLNRPSALHECTRLLELWQIGELRNKTNRHISGGQKRLLQLAVAMAGSPPVLILDEPTNNLDPQRRKQVWDNLRNLNHDQGTTVIFITHDAIEAEKIIQRVGIMRQGKLVALGKPLALKAQVDHKMRLELFFSPGISPRLPPRLTHHPLDAGRWLVYLDRDEIGAILNTLNLDEMDDFRLYSATLEDLYMHYITEDIP